MGYQRERRRRPRKKEEEGEAFWGERQAGHRIGGKLFSIKINLVQSEVTTNVVCEELLLPLLSDCAAFAAFTSFLPFVAL